MKRSPLKRDPDKARAWEQRSRDHAIAKARTKQRKPLPRKSAKQRKIDAQRPYVRAAVIERDGLGCYARALVPSVECASPNPERRLYELHEVVKRSRWRMGVLDPANCRLLCQAMHDWTEDHPKEAEMRGLLVPSWVGRDGLQEAVQLSLGWANGNPAHPSWWSDTDRAAFPLPNLRRVRPTPLEDRPL